jgi:hypothetical protein
MKKSLLLFAFTLLFFTSSYGRKPIVCDVFTSGDGRWDFLYDRIRMLPGEMGNQDCFWLFCESPGWQRCRLSNASGSTGTQFFPVDHIDTQNSDALLEVAELNMKEGKTSGTHQVVVQVAGETNKRVYSVSWTVEQDGSYKATLNFHEL